MSEIDHEVAAAAMRNCSAQVAELRSDGRRPTTVCLSGETIEHLAVLAIRVAGA